MESVEGIEQHHEGYDEVPALAQHGPRVGQLLGNELDAVAGGDQVDLHEDRKVIEQRGDQRRDDDLRVVHFEEFGHQERRRAHDRRHELAAG